jgi:large subunit ribosomal protein L6
MSRIGNKPIPLPKGITFSIDGKHITIKGPKGSLERDIRPEMIIEKENDILLIKGTNNSRKVNAFRGLTRSLVNNMVIGVEKGFKKKLVVEGVGYKVDIKKDTITLNVGYSQPVDFLLPKGISATIDKSEITLESIDKELLGLTAAKIRSIRKPEPYKGKGIRYVDEHIIRKVGKTAGKK